MDKIVNNQLKKTEQKHSERRRFLKKVAYTTPKLIALGYLARPENANASKFGSTPEPPVDAGDWA